MKHTYAIGDEVIVRSTYPTRSDPGVVTKVGRSLVTVKGETLGGGSREIVFRIENGVENSAWAQQHTSTALRITLKSVSDAEDARRDATKRINLHRTNILPGVLSKISDEDLVRLADLLDEILSERLPERTW